MILHFDNIGSIGVIKDIPPYELPPEAWSDVRNVRFRDGKIEKFLGHRSAYDQSASVTETIAVDPWWVLPVQTPGNRFWVYASRNQVFAATSVSNNNKITRFDSTASADLAYSATPSLRWNGGVLGNIPILNNGFDAPQKWDPVGLSQRLQDLDYDTSVGDTWSDQSLTARTVRPYKNFLVALDVDKAGTRHRQMVKWSHPAESNAVPSSWNETDATKDTGEHHLSETDGIVIDCLPLKDVNVIYKEDETIGMQFIGGKFVFRFFNMFKTFGVISRDCVIEILGKHLVLARGDVILHDGQHAESILTKKLRDWLFTSIDTNFIDNCFMAHNFFQREVWICFPVQGQSLAFFPTRALVWNYAENTFYVRDLPNVAHANWGSIELTGTGRTWSTIPGTWATTNESWGDDPPVDLYDRLLLASPDSAAATLTPKLYVADETEEFDGVLMTSRVERQGLAFIYNDREGRLKYDKTSRKLINAVWPRIEANVGTKIKIFVGAQEHEKDPVVWTDPNTFTVGESLKVDVRVNTRIPAIAFETDTSSHWSMSGYDLDVDVVGRY